MLEFSNIEASSPSLDRFPCCLWRDEKYWNDLEEAGVIEQHAPAFSNHSSSRYFFSPSPPFNFFFAFAFFLPLRSLFFSAGVPAFITSAYFVKNPSSSSGCTIVDNLILSSRCSFDLPLEARISTGSGDKGARSGKLMLDEVMVGDEAGGD